jgi:hypothetical protein
MLAIKSRAPGLSSCGAYVAKDLKPFVDIQDKELIPG